MNTSSTPLLIPALLTLAAFASADVIHVPDDHPTIQAAIDASVSGDVIIVRPGTYVENINFAGKNVHLKSEMGPAATVIDGNHADSVVSFRSGEGHGAILEGFTIRNGLGDNTGGGILIFFTEPTIRGNVIEGNRAAFGGGIMCWGDFFGNPTNPTISGNVITGNTADYGGGVRCTLHSLAEFDGNTIANNHATIDGGGVAVDWLSAVSFDGDVISGNSAGSTGGGVALLDECAAGMDAVLIARNTADQGGGCFVRGQSALSVVESTFAGNAASQQGGGVYVGGSLYVLNSILWDDKAPTGSEIHDPGSANIGVSYSDVEGGWPGTGNIDADPLFFDAANGDFHLRQDPPQAGVVNPCVDAGDPATVLGGGWTRTDCVPDTGVVDMGYHYTTCGPSASATYRNAGTNPASHAATTLPVLGTTYTATVRVAATTGHASAWLVGYATPTTALLGGGQTILVNAADPLGELLLQSPQPGPEAVFAIPVPNDPAWAGVALSTQAVHYGTVAPFALSNAQDLVLGY